jgi:hypothetical protein
MFTPKVSNLAQLIRLGNRVKKACEVIDRDDDRSQAHINEQLARRTPKRVNLSPQMADLLLKFREAFDDIDRRHNPLLRTFWAILRAARAAATLELDAMLEAMASIFEAGQAHSHARRDRLELIKKETFAGAYFVLHAYSIELDDKHRPFLSLRDSASCVLIDVNES